MKSPTILFCLATIAAFVAISLADAGDPDVTIAGNYTLVTPTRNGKFRKYMALTGLRDFLRKKIESAQPRNIHIRIKDLTGNSYQVVKDLDGIILQMEFESDKEFETEGVYDKKATTRIVVDPLAKTAKVVIQLEGESEVRQDIKFSKGGFSITMMYRNAVAVLEFSRDKE